MSVKATSLVSPVWKPLAGPTSIHSGWGGRSSGASRYPTSGIPSTTPISPLRPRLMRVRKRRRLGSSGSAGSDTPSSGVRVGSLIRRPLQLSLVLRLEVADPAEYGQHHQDQAGRRDEIAGGDAGRQQ